MEPSNLNCSLKMKFSKLNLTVHCYDSGWMKHGEKLVVR